RPDGSPYIVIMTVPTRVVHLTADGRRDATFRDNGIAIPGIWARMTIIGASLLPDDGLLLETEAGRVELRPDGTIDENPSIPVHPYDETFVNFEPEILIAPSRVPYLVAGWTIEECLPSSNPCTPGEDQGIAGRYDADQWTLAYTDGIQFAS